jgi:hypothetical protein
MSASAQEDEQMTAIFRPLAIGLALVGSLAMLLIAGCPPTDGADNNGQGHGNPPERFQLTIAIEGGGSVDPTSGEYDAGSAVTLTATAGSGWRFDRWEGDLTGSESPASITISEDLAITAVFVAVAGTTFGFYAVYDWIVDADQLPEGDAVGPAVMSANAQKAAFSNGRGATNRKGYTLNTDGSGLTAYNLPDGEGVADHVAIDADGSRVYFASTYDEKIFKIEGGAVSTISWSVPPGPDGVDDLHTTSDGATLIFREYSGDVWRVGHDGTGLTKIIDDAAVPCTDGTPGGIADIAVSADGGTIAFVMTVLRQRGGNPGDPGSGFLCPEAFGLPAERQAKRRSPSAEEAFRFMS